MWLALSSVWLSMGEESCDVFREAVGSPRPSLMSKPVDDWLLDSEIDRQVILMFRVRADSLAACGGTLFIYYTVSLLMVIEI